MFRVSLDLLANDRDPEDDALAVTSISFEGQLFTVNPLETLFIERQGIVIEVSDSLVTISKGGDDPFALGAAPLVLSYGVTDARGAASTATLTIDFGTAPTNRPPEAVGDSVAAIEDTPVTFDVRSNDSDPDDDPLTVTAINGTALSTTAPVTIAGAGTVVLNANGTLTFTPQLNFNGTPSFSYTVSDGFGGTATGTVDIAIAAVNDAPTGTTRFMTIDEDTTVSFGAIGTDGLDSDGDPVSVTAVNGTSISATAPVVIAGVGTVSLTPGGMLSFTPAANFNGAAGFDFTVSDGKGGTAQSRADFNVRPVADAPVAGADVFAASEDVPVTLAVLANDSDADGDTLSIIAINGTAISLGSPVAVAGAGSVALNADGALTFTPLPNISGPQSFSYTVSDGTGRTATSTANLDIAAVNDGPVAAADTVATTEDTPVTFDVRANDSDLDGDPLAVIAINGTAISVGAPVTVAGAGTVALNANGTLTFTPLPDISGARSFSYTISDGNGGTATANATLNITSVNDAPVATADVFAATEDTPTSFDVRPNDSDGDGGTLSVVAVNGAPISIGEPVTIPGVGTISLNANGTLGFTPALNANGTKNFSYTLSDGQGGTTLGSVTVNIAAVADGSTLTVASNNVGFLVDNAENIAASGVGQIDVDGPGTIGTLTLTDGEAAKLIDAGLSLVDQDGATVVVATQLSNNLQSLQTLGVDSIDAANGVTAISVDAGNLSLLLTGSLPQFDVAQSDGALDVTLNVAGTIGGGAPGALFAGVTDPAGLIAGLGAAGIDHIDLGGSGTNASAQISGAQASQLIGAGIDFADDDVVTVAATQLSNNLQSLQTLGVDVVAVVGGATVLDIDAGSLAALSPAGLPQFDVAQSDGALDLTLNVAGGGDLFAGQADPLGLIAALGGAGIDHLDINGDAMLGTTQISDAQAEALVNAGIDFDGDDTINVVAVGTQLGTTLSELQTLGVDDVTTTSELGVLSLDAGLEGSGGLATFIGTELPQFDDALDVSLGVKGADFLSVDVETLAADLLAAGIDHLHIDPLAPPLPIAEAHIGALIAAGLDFTDDSAVTMMAAGASTHLSTTLHDLQELGVDSIQRLGPTGPLTVDLGENIDGLAALPQFDLDQPDAALDVTLRLNETNFLDDADLGTLLGVDVLAGLTTPDLYGDLIDALIAAGIDRINLDTSGRVELTDGLADVLIAFEGFTAEDAELVLNAAGSGDHLRTSLHEMAHLGVDAVEVDDQGADPVYVDFGDGPLDETTLLGMLDALDSDNSDSTPLFTGSAEVALVVDQATAEAIAQASGALDKLAELGFTEITVLDGVDNSFIGMLESGPLEVKLIGQDDDLYDHLNP